MKDERGFFTIVGLCLLLAVAISIRGIQEFERNYSIGVTNFQIECDLQNLADSALVEASENIPEDAQNYEGFSIDVNTPVISERLRKLNANVLVRGTKQNLIDRKDEYVSTSDIPTPLKNGEDKDHATILISIASCDSPNVAGRIYRRSLAYILDSAPQIICFVNDLSASEKIVKLQE